MEKKKISIFIVSLYGGGAERVVSILLKHLADSFDVHLVLLDDCIEYGIPPQQKVHFLSHRNSKNPLVNILKIPLLAFRYYRFLMKNNIQVSFSFLSRPNFISGFLKFFNWKGKIIISERQYTSAFYTKENFSGRVGRFLVRWLYNKADLIICNSKLIVQDLQNSFLVNTEYAVVYNPIDINEVNKKTGLETEECPKNTAFTFITIGRMADQKNHRLLIEAASLIREFNFRVQIIGKGELQNILQQEIEKYHLQDKVLLLPHTNNPFPCLKNADCFVLSSNFEGFPNVILEALACGLPVISTDCKSGPRELLAPSMDINEPLKTGAGFYEYGMLVTVNNAKDMATAMKMMYKDTLHKDPLKNVQRAQEFEVGKIISRFKRVLEQY